MLCSKCRNGVYPQAISIGICKLCGKMTYSPNQPPHVLCDKCSENKRLCAQCGAPLFNDKKGD